MMTSPAITTMAWPPGQSSTLAVTSAPLLELDEPVTVRKASTAKKR